MKRVITICIICLVLVLVPYISYRVILCSFELPNESVKIINKLKKGDYVSIKKKDYKGDYLEYKNVKIANDFDSFLIYEKRNNLD